MTNRPEPVTAGPDHYAYVTIVGEGHLTELNTAIGLSPDDGWDRDDIRPRGRPEPYGFSRWSIYSGLPRGAPIEDHIAATLDRLQNHEDAIAALGPQWKKYISVTGHFEDPSTLIGISVRTHRRAAGFGLDYDFDFYFDGM